MWKSDTNENSSERYCEIGNCHNNVIADTAVNEAMWYGWLGFLAEYCARDIHQRLVLVLALSSQIQSFSIIHQLRWSHFKRDMYKTKATFHHWSELNSRDLMEEMLLATDLNKIAWEDLMISKGSLAFNISGRLSDWRIFTDTNPESNSTILTDVWKKMTMQNKDWNVVVKLNCSLNSFLRNKR